MKYFKIYTTDDQGRQVIRLLHTDKSYAAVKDQYGRCEEMFDEEAEGMKSAGVAVIEDEENKISDAGTDGSLQQKSED